MLQKPFRHTRSPDLSFISASASSRPENLSSALSLAVASLARLSSLSFSSWVSTPRSVRDSPTFFTFLTASAETDLPAAFTKSTSSCWTTLFAFPSCGASSGTASAPGWGWFAFPVFWTLVVIVG